MIPGLFKQWQRSRAKFVADIDIWRSARRSFTVLTVFIAAHTLLMIRFENLSLGDALWLTLTTITTVGYGDLSAASVEGRISTIIVLYFGGVFVLAHFAGEYFEGRLERKKRMLEGNWEWDMVDHLLIINTPASGGTAYFLRLFTQIRMIPELKNIPIQILTRQYPEGLPTELRKLRVVHHTGYPDKKQNLEAVNVRAAKYIVVLSKHEYDITSDALTFDILHRIQELGSNQAFVIAECIDDENRERLVNAGAHAVLRPVRSYPELLVRAIAAPGSEKILENLFMHDGDHPQRYEVKVKHQTWGQVVSLLMSAGCGTALAYIDESGEPVCNAPPNQEVNAQALLLMVRENQEPSSEHIRRALQINESLI
ncbi:MAG: ion channel [Gammaproteobacteria bacterium]|nr:ion channel [Gammaproteobacteria bacterium]MDH5800382.1 ion channel [Gammaproteobacteria bacterium]